MRSKTSFFNGALFRKSVSRFWPVWGSYLAVWIFVLPVNLISMARYGNLNAVNGQSQLYNYAVMGGTMIGAVFAVLSAMAVWSFLYNNRSAHGMACLPVRREGQFVSALLAGFLPMLLANAAVALLTALVLGINHALDITSLLGWFAIVSLIDLFYFAFATLCAQLTGSIIILPLVYGVLNFVFVGAETLLRSVFGQFVYGMDAGLSGLSTRLLSPPVGMLTRLPPRIMPLLTEPQDGVREVYAFSFTGWGVILGYAAVGLVMIVAALLLFRARRMETAGDVVAVRPLKPVFRWCMALGSGLLLGSLLYFLLFQYHGINYRATFVGLLAFLLIGAFIGWFAAEMLMKKSFRVFQKRAWTGYGLCCLVIVALMLGMRLDLFGYERRVPEADRVQSVAVRGDGEFAVLETPAGVGQTLELHRQIIADKQWNQSAATRLERGDSASIMCDLTYYLTNGSTMTRSYQLYYETDLGGGDPTDLHDVAALNDLMNTPEAVASRKDTGFPITAANIKSATVSVNMTATECAALAGYDSAEEFILDTYAGRYGKRYSDWNELSPHESYEILAEIVNSEAINMNREGWYETDPEEFVKSLDWDAVYFSYDLPLSAGDAWELYSACVQPDLKDGGLGKVWLAEGPEYRNTVYSAHLSVSAREKAENNAPVVVSGNVAVPTATDGYRYANFFTTPTVDSVRTNAWLRDRGLILHTVGEVLYHEG